MSTSRSSASNQTSTHDQRTTQTINAGIGGDIEDSTVVSGNYGDTELYSFVDESTSDYESNYSYSDDSDNSFNLDLTDSSDNSQNYDYESHYDFNDSSDRSFAVDYEDSSTVSTDNRVDNSVVTDGGAFKVVEGIGLSLIEKLGESQKETLNAANNLAARSLDGALSIKAGQTITEPANQTVRELAKTGTVIAGVAAVAYVASKFIGGKAA